MAKLCYIAGVVLAPKFWGALPQPLHHRVLFLRSPKPEKYEKYELNSLGYRPTFEIYH